MHGRRGPPGRAAGRRVAHRGRGAAGWPAAARPGRRPARRRVHRAAVRRRAGALGRRPHRSRSCATRLVPLEATVGREMHRLTVALLGVDERRPGVREAVQATLDLLRGLGVANLLSDDSARRDRPADHLEAPARHPAHALTAGRTGHHRPEAPWSTSRPARRTWPPSPPTWTPWWRPCPRPTGRRPTPAPGWTVGHQIAHLAWTDHVALLAATDPEAFYATVTAAPDATRLVDVGAEEFLAPPAELLARWRAGRDRARRRAGRRSGRRRTAWYGTADVGRLDGHRPDDGDLGARRRTWPTRSASSDPDSDRLRHVAHLGFRTLGHGFAAHGRPAPTAPVRVELAGARTGRPGRSGPADAADRVTGPALDFCLLVTQRRHRADLALVATGPVADEWLDVAQAFAGPPGDGRRAGRRDRGTGMIRDRQRLRLLRRPVHRLAGDARRRRAGRADRRLPRRADHADPRPGPAARPRPRATRRRSCGRLETVPRHRPGPRRADRHQRRRAQPGRAGRRHRDARRPARPAGPGRVRRGRRRPATGRADRQRLPRRVRDRRLPRRRRGRGGHRPGHRRVAGRSARPSPASAGAATTSTRWPGRPWPGTSSSAARRPPAATSASSPSCPTAATGPGSRSPSCTPTARRCITKHPGTGGAVTVETVTAQLLYEIGAPAYLGPDVVTRLDTVTLHRRRARTGSGSPAYGARRRRPR